MTPEEMREQFFQLFNKSMKDNIFDKTDVTSKDMDDFFKLNMLRLMESNNPASYNTFTPVPMSPLNDTLKIQMRFAIETMKIQIQYMEKLIGEMDVK